MSSGFTSISKCEPFRVFTKIFILGQILFYLSTAISTLENGATDPQSPSAMCVCKFREREKKKNEKISETQIRVETVALKSARVYILGDGNY